MHKQLRWDIFCRVVDNFGDAGVCWRLACLLSAEQGGRVRLVIDDLGALRKLHPEVRDEARQRVEAIDIVRWATDTAIEPDAVDVIVDAFGCGPPEPYLARAAALERRPLWIVLEYLSAERWVADHHALPSPHPRLALERYFFFPGFTRETGGLLRERDLLGRRQIYGPEKRESLWRELGHEPAGDAMAALVFAYPYAPLAELFSAMAEGAYRIVVALPESRLVAEALRFFGSDAVPENRLLTRGQLEVRFVPFVPQARFDELLWTCDVNFVRGEDSFVRAQWAARRFVWHIYAQEAKAHRRKLDAFLDLYTAGIAEESAVALRDLSLAWNQLDRGRVSTASAWEAYLRESGVLRSHATGWARRLAQAGELAANLARFCSDKLK